MPSPDDDADHGLLSPVWAGTAVAGATSDLAVLRGIVRFEVALATLTAPPGVDARIAAAADDLDVVAIAREARIGGNPVIPLLGVLRSRLDDESASFLHRGATSQDALDTALVLVAKDAIELIMHDAAAAVHAFSEHAETHRGTVMVGRTLAKAATPTTLGLKIAGWTWNIARAAASLRRACADLPIQLGGAVGTLASFTASGADSIDIAARMARTLGLAEAVAPWHVLRSPITRVGNALVELTDGYGTIGENVTALARLGELDDGAAGGSSTMPHKSNPVYAVLLNAAGRQAAHLGASLHTAAITVDERPDGAWHAEWEPFRSLLRVAGGAASTARSLATGLTVYPAVISANVTAAAHELLAESQRFTSSAVQPSDYLGVADSLVTRLLRSAKEELA